MSNDIDWEILDRYFSGLCTPEQVREIERWVATEPSRGDLLASARAVWEATGVVPRRFDVDAAWTAVRPRMERSKPVRAPGRFALPRDRSFQYVAAAVLVLALGGALTLRLTGLDWISGGHSAPAPAREYLTHRAQRADFHLRDGTHVVLGVASRLEVPASFGHPGREVFLEGEAYFEVQHDSASRFRVRTAEAITEDLGTAFAVRAYRGDSGAQVAVAEGRVVLHPGIGAPDARGTLLSRGQVGKTQRGGPVAVLDPADLAPYLGWAQGRLVFKDTPLREALPSLSRWFDLDFRLADTSLGSRLLTASLGDQPTNETLDLLALSLGLRQERRGETVMLYPKFTTR
jgi:ferric-dicitrate binding protein FerR (iron transport regulator)